MRRARVAARSRLGRALGLILALGLLAAAIGAVWAQRDVVSRATDHLREAPPWLLAAVFLLPLVSWLTTSITFWLLSKRYAPVPASDMTALIGAAWLLNHLPLRPGMVGRVAYHKAYHGMAVADAVRVMVSAMILTAASLGALVIVAAALPLVDAPGAQYLALATPTLLCLLAAIASHAVAPRFSREIWALFFRALDMLSWTARYVIVFRLLGEPVSLERVVAVTAVGQVAMLVPITGSGVGIREWAVGLTLTALAAAGSREEAAAIGLTADLINRAAETLLAVPVGLACTAWLARARRRRPPQNDPAD